MFMPEFNNDDFDANEKLADCIDDDDYLYDCKQFNTPDTDDYEGRCRKYHIPTTKTGFTLALLDGVYFFFRTRIWEL